MLKYFFGLVFLIGIIIVLYLSPIPYITVFVKTIGGPAVVIGFTAWIGHETSTRNARKENHELRKELEKGNHELKKELEALKSKFTTKEHVSKVQFDKEFELYQEIWKLYRNASARLYSAFMTNSKESILYYEEEAPKLLEFLSRYEPFIDTLVYTSTKNLLNLGANHSSFGKTKKELANIVKDYDEKLCLAIRKRIWHLEII